MHVSSHAIGNAHDQLEVSANTRQVACLPQKLKITVGIGIAARFLVGIRSRKNNFGGGCSLSHEHVLHDNESVLQREWIDVVTSYWICSDYIQGTQFARLCSAEHAFNVEPSLSWHRGTVLFREWRIA